MELTLRAGCWTKFCHTVTLYTGIHMRLIYIKYTVTLTVYRCTFNIHRHSATFHIYLDTQIYLKYMCIQLQLSDMSEFSAPVQTGHGAHPASCTTGTGSFPGVKRPGSGVDHPSPPHLLARLKKVKLYLYSPPLPSLQVTG